MHKLLIIMFFLPLDKVESDIYYETFLEDEIADYPKCCALNSALKRVMATSAVECSSEELPLTHYEIKSSKIISKDKEFSTDCVNTTCIDFINDSDNWSLIKVENCEIKQTYKDYNFYPKCCPNNYSYDPMNYNCVKKTTPTITHDKLQVFNISLAHCNRSMSIVDFRQKFTLNVSDKSVQIGERFVEYPYYCLDTEARSEKQVIRACLPLEEVCTTMKKRCIRKCCPDGEIYMSKHGRGVCYPYYTAPFNVSNDSRFNKSHADYGVTFSRPGSKYVARKEHEFFVDEFGYFHTLRDDVWQIYAPGSAYYCAESFLNRSGRAKPIVMLEFVESEIRTMERQKFFVQGCILGVSSLFMCATAAFYAAVPVLRNVHGRCVLMYCAFMGVAFAALSYVQMTPPNSNHDVCVSLGYLILFTMLGAFAWMNVVCFDMWMAFGSVKASSLKKRGKDLRKFIYYNLYAWGVPITVCGLALIVFFTECLPKAFVPSIGVVSCYFDRRDVLGYMVFFLIPIAAMQLINIVLFIRTSIYCVKVKNEIRRMQTDPETSKAGKFLDDKKTFIMVLKIFIVMGIPWTFECVSHIMSFRQTTTALIVEAAMDYFNSMQGIIIFCILILKRRVLRSLKGRLGLGPVPASFAAGRTQAQTIMANSSKKRCPKQDNLHTGSCKSSNETEETGS